MAPHQPKPAKGNIIDAKPLEDPFLCPQRDEKEFTVQPLVGEVIIVDGIHQNDEKLRNKIEEMVSKAAILSNKGRKQLIDR